jgi:hypothetical protein
MGLSHYLFREKSKLFFNKDGSLDTLGWVTGVGLFISPVIPAAIIGSLGVGLVAEGVWKLTKGAVKTVARPRVPKAPKPAKVVYVPTPPTRAAVMQDILEEYRKAQELLSCLPEDEREIAAEHLRDKFMRKVEQNMQR